MSIGTPEVIADRERIAAIVNSPEAAGQLHLAVKLALTGASVADAKIALLIVMEPLSSDQVADSINSKMRNR